jgi:hypothetical protein
MTPRLKSGLWVQATLRTGLNGTVVHKGDPDAGGILVVLRGRQGLAVFSRVTGPDGEPAWLRAVGTAPLTEPDADAYIARQTARDPDLWVIEMEVADLVPPFEGRILS